MWFSSKSLCCQGNWAYLENRPHCALTSVNVGETSGKKTLVACGFPVKASVVRVIGHTWKTDHIVP